MSRTLLAAVLFLVLAAPAGALTPRIVGGTEAAADAYPAQAQVDVVVGRDEYLCGGTLVAAQWVLTAGHCVSDERSSAIFAATDFTVRLGSTTLDAGTPYTVDSVSRAPGYNADSLAYDAALLHLSTAAPEAPLALTATAAATGQVARVIGWGTTTEDGDVSDQLREVDVPVVSDTTCSAAYGGAIVAATMVCAGYAQGGADACQGDSGGPLMLAVDGAWELAGIVSTGDGCAEAGKYGVYTDMANTALRSWFGTTTGSAVTAVATATPTTAATPYAAVTSAASAPRAALKLAHRCSRHACSFAVSFASTGQVSASVTLTRAAERRLGFARRQIASASRTVRTAGTTELKLTLPKRIRRTVKARLRVVAVTADGQRTVKARTVRLGGETAQAAS